LNLSKIIEFFQIYVFIKNKLRCINYYKNLKSQKIILKMKSKKMRTSKNTEEVPVDIKKDEKKIIEKIEIKEIKI
jgi:hypothetical protein